MVRAQILLANPHTATSSARMLRYAQLPTHQPAAAVSTMLLGTTGGFFAALNMWAFACSAFLIGDKSLWWQRHVSPKLQAVIIMFCIPTLLNVSTMWVDIGLRSMKGTKASRVKTKRKFQCGVWTFNGFFSLAILVSGGRRVDVDGQGRKLGVVGCSTFLARKNSLALTHPLPRMPLPVLHA